MNAISQVTSRVIARGVVPAAQELSQFLLHCIRDNATQEALLRSPVYMLVYKHHEIQIGMMVEGKIVLERPEELKPEMLKELRLFSEQGELYLWKQRQTFHYRLRVDDAAGEKSHVYMERHLMWGLEKDGDGRTVVEPNRGMRLTMPFQVKDAKLPLKYDVQNYFEYDKNGLIQFYDARLVRLLDSTDQTLPAKEA